MRSPAASTLFDFVLDIRQHRAANQMPRIATWAIVATMHDEETGQQRPMRQFVGDSMDFSPAAIVAANAKFPVAVPC
jgi:hypothetical protein